MSLLGIHLTFLIGPTVPVPAPPLLTEALQRVRVTHSGNAPSVFQITFQSGRGGLLDMLDYLLLSNPLLRPFNRLIVIVTFNAMPRVLMDGIITNMELPTSNQPGASSLTITGDDLTYMMDREERSSEYPAQSDDLIAIGLIGRYAPFGLIPEVVSPPLVDPPSPSERVPTQQDTDLAYLNKLAQRHGYVFYVTPGPMPGTSTAYWGPPIRSTLPQHALSVNMGSATNVDSINFRYNALEPAIVTGQVQDRDTNQTMPVQTFASTRFPLASQPALMVHQPNIRRKQFRETGRTIQEAQDHAQGETDASTDRVVQVTGSLDATRYGDLLQPRGVVGVRGAGYSYNGSYYVDSVTHVISKGEYKQEFTLSREGIGSTTPLVIP